MLLFCLSQQEDYDQVSLEDQHYQGDGSMLSSKAKLLLRDSKKELLRYVGFISETSSSIFIQSNMCNLIFHFSCQMASVNNEKCNSKP